MFHFTPQHSTHFHPYGYPVQPTYNSFHDLDLDDDLPSSFSPFSLGAVDPRHRHQLEQELQAREQELTIRKEIQRRRQEAQKVAVRQQILAQLEERERRAQHQALMREQQRQAVHEHELRRKMISRQQEEEAQHRRQAHARRQQLAEQEDQDDSSLDAVLQTFLPLLFGPGFQLQQDSHSAEASSPPSNQQPDSTPAKDTIAEPLPSSDAVASAPAPAVEESTAREDYAAPSSADQLHQHYRTHLHRRQALSTLSSLGDSLSAQQAAFTLPSTLTFQPSPPSSTTEYHSTTSPATSTPKLAFQSSNAPFLAYEDFLVSLLSKIDAVSSDGDRSVKQARKALVKKVEGELKRLDEEREKAWEKEQAKDGTETEALGGEFDLGVLFH
ncbi:hypothetical protein BCR35DRAFT_298233 [Leucosporidium creatinivorum]|uniref:BAG domain-containing protein n=1 Tax=Leucosporidium creatinivorum TaxID=106004 RepID=A0A1Y2G849_9BASI|nr:hypothetical protein BCR35DRAFT_298233 [Leucosporidium creatinivorum]